MARDAVIDRKVTWAVFKVITKGQQLYFYEDAGAYRVQAAADGRVFFSAVAGKVDRDDFETNYMGSAVKVENSQDGAALAIAGKVP